MRWLIVSLLLLVACASPVGATEYFVRTDGNNNCNGLVNVGGSSGACAFGDLDGCFTNMASGDTCTIAAGQYNGKGTDGANPYFNLCDAPNGTPGAYTTFRAENTRGKPLFCQDAPCTGNPINGALPAPQVGFGDEACTEVDTSTQCRYIKIDGFDVDGLFTAFGDPTLQCIRDVTITNSRFRGGGICDNNYGALYINGAQRVQFDHNVVDEIDSADCFTRIVMMTTGPCTDCVYEFNKFDGSNYVAIIPSRQVQLKRENHNEIWRYNYFLGETGSTAFSEEGGLYSEGPLTNATITGNISENSDIIHFKEAEQGDVDGLTITNNTAINGLVCANNSPNAVPNVTCKNNITQRGLRPAGGNETYITAVSQVNTSVFNTWDFDYNYYDTLTGTFGATFWSIENQSPGFFNFADWKTTLDSLGCASCDANAVEDGTVSYVGGSDGINYHLAGGEAALTACEGGTECGAYAVTDCVGHTCGVSVQTFPNSGWSSPGGVTWR